MNITRIRKDILKKAENLESEIEDLEFFIEALRNEDVQHEYYRNTEVSIHKKTKSNNSIFNFFAKYKGSNEIETYIKIPEKMRLEISALSVKWLKELKQRANDNLTLKNINLRIKYNDNEVISIETGETVFDGINIENDIIIEKTVDIWNENLNKECLNSDGALYKYLLNENQCSEDERDYIIKSINDFFEELL